MMTLRRSVRAPGGVVEVGAGERLPVEQKGIDVNTLLRTGSHQEVLKWARAHLETALGKLKCKF